MRRTLQRGNRVFTADIALHTALRRCVLGAAVVAISASGASASLWDGAGGNWGFNGSPGWNGTGVPNSIGATAILPATSGTITVDGSYTVGTIELSGTGSNTRTINSGTLTLNQDGAGSGTAVIRNIATNTANRLSFGSGSTLTLADNLLISNTGNATGTYSIASSGLVGGTGNVTISNVSNSITSGPITLTGNNTFAGSVWIEKGALTFNNNALGNTANGVTLGSAGNSATLVSTGSATDLANNIVVAATSGTNLLGSTHNGTITFPSSTFSGNILLNGDLTVTSIKTNGSTLSFTKVLSGVGNLTKIGVGSATFTGDNTYTGNTTIDEGSLTLSSAGELRFKVQDANVSNRILGDSTVILNGILRIDVSALSATTGTWNLVDVTNLAETFDAGTFGVAFVGGPLFNEAVPGIHTSGDWTFSESTGTLTLVPEPGMLAGVAGALVLASRRSRRRGV